jgi:hypothetical protein
VKFYSALYSALPDQWQWVTTPFGNRIVFGNLRQNKQLKRFTLRGRKKADAQWKLYCMVHNIEKLAHHGYAQ